METLELRQQALHWLCCADASTKCQGVHALAQSLAGGQIHTDPRAVLTPRPDQSVPGRPVRPPLVAPGQVPTRSAFTLEGHAALLHAICHIEFNAINLALDAVWRFAGMPDAYYLDWFQVAEEEAGHFELLQAQLQALRPAHPWQYGDFEAHDGLWSMCTATAEDITARMALVPRTLEARGLDATPLIQARLRRAGTPAALDTVARLDIILRDEIGHVRIGNHWYRWLCEQQGLDPVAHYRVLVRRHRAPRLKPPFNTDARLLAGFSRHELDFLEQVI